MSHIWVSDKEMSFLDKWESANEKKQTLALSMIIESLREVETTNERWSTIWCGPTKEN
jgi:hypothetical protein